MTGRKMHAKTSSVLASIRPEYIPLESHLAEPIAWCPPASTAEDTTLFVIVKSGTADPKILRLVNGKVSNISIRKLPFVSAIAPKPKTILDRLKPTKIATGVAYSFAVLILIFVALVSANLMSARTVLTNSMSGTFEPGDVVVTANWIEPEVDDIAIYRARDFEGNVRSEFVHRIISGNEATQFVFKGDNNKSKDPLPVSREDIVGVVLFWMPNLGAILNPKNLLALFSLGIFVYFGAGYLRDEYLERKLLARKVKINEA